MKSEGGARKSFGERRGGKVGDPPASILRVTEGENSAKGGVAKSGILPGSILRVREAQKSSGDRRDGKVGDPPLRAATRNIFNFNTQNIYIWS